MSGGLKGLYPLQGLNSPGAVLFIGSFGTNGASAPTSIVGNRFTVSAPAAGVYTVTLLDGPVSNGYALLVHGAQIAVPNSTVVAALRQFVNITVDGTFQIATQSTLGTDANLGAGTVVSFILVLSNTSAAR